VINKACSFSRFKTLSGLQKQILLQIAIPSSNLESFSKKSKVFYVEDKKYVHENSFD